MYQLVDENAAFIVVSKSSGVCVHCEPNQVGLIVRLKQDLQLDQLFPVHRLDKVTSGLLLCAKTRAAASELSQLFEQRDIEKYYLALGDKKPKKKQGLISGDMEASRRGAWKLCTTQHKPAVTQFFSYHLPNGASRSLPASGLRLFLLKPKTGKTHQLRVALKSIGSPIVGDRLYGHPLVVDHQEDDVKGGAAIYLHAFVLRFSLQDRSFEYVDIPHHWNNTPIYHGDVLGQVLSELGIDRPWLLQWPNIKRLAH
ncbi:TIGR01621 family pseudouridine synthase [Eionea flava]